MCNFTEIDGAGWIESMLQIFFLSAACLFQAVGLTIAILLIGFAPLYYFAFYFYKKKLSLKSIKTSLLLLLTVGLTLLLSATLWLSAIILGQWG